MKRVYHAQPDILQKPVERCYALGLICVAQNCNEAGARVACSHEKSTCVSDSLRLPPVLCTYHGAERFLDPNFSHRRIFSLCLAFSFLLSPSSMFGSDGQKKKHISRQLAIFTIK